jgi:beta-glucosidase
MLMRRPSVRRAALIAVPLALTAAALAIPAGAAPATDAPAAQAAYQTDAQGRTLITRTGAPYLNAHLSVRTRVGDLLARMTLQEKIGQMTQAERGDLGDPTRVTDRMLGSVLSGGGSVPDPNTPTAWADMVDLFQSHALQTRLQIPIVYGVDSVHGHGNLYGATVFPHNVGLGATRDAELIQKIEHVVAEETRATGPQWAFAPCVCVARDERWGRTYESLSENPLLVAQLTGAIEGFQGNGESDLTRNDRVLASTKHYAGDGDTEFDTAAGDYTIDQGITITNRQDFLKYDLAPYIPAVKKYNTGTVMPSFSSIDWTEDGVGNPIKMHANRELITDVLKNGLGFDGFVISDWEGIHQIPGDYPTQVRTGVNAGIDMFMEPFSSQAFEDTLLAEVNAGRVPMSRIDDAVSRILAKKFDLGLFEHPYTDRSNLDKVGSSQHRALARQAVAESQVLLKNSGGLLPLKKSAKVYVAGRNADDMGNQAGGWTLTWQGGSGQHRIPGNTILDGINQVAPGAKVTYSKDGSAPTAGSDVAVVVVGETPYSEGFGDIGGPRWGYDPGENGVLREPKSLDLQPGDAAVIDKVCGAIDKCVVMVVSGRPQVIPPAQLAKIDSLVASWLPGSQGEGVADVVFGNKPFTGKLSHTWPASAAQEPINIGDANYHPAFPYGWGLRTK